MPGKVVNRLWLHWSHEPPGNRLFGVDPVSIGIGVAHSCMQDISWTRGQIGSKFAWSTWEHIEEMIRNWWPCPNFQGHSSLQSSIGQIWACVVGGYLFSLKTILVIFGLWLSCSSILIHSISTMSCSFWLFIFNCQIVITNVDFCLQLETLLFHYYFIYI